VTEAGLKTNGQTGQAPDSSDVARMASDLEKECCRGEFARSADELPEILREGQECPFCHFAKLKREGDEIACPVCGYGRAACT